MSAALELLDELVARHPEPFQLAMAHSQRADCLFTLGRPDEAFDALRASLAAERAFPQVRSPARLAFAVAAVGRERADLYDEALTLLDECARERLDFPVQRYQFHGTRAAILAARDNLRAAAEEAKRAEAARRERTSGFRHHPALGLVTADALDARTAELVRRLSGPTEV